MKMIEIIDLTKDYGRGKGVFSLRFDVEEGEVFGFLGPNGAGKTTTIRSLMGFSNSTAGRCRIGGLNCRTRSAEIQKSLGYIPGEMAFPDDMTGTGFLTFMAAYRGMKGPGRTAELVERFELDAHGSLKKMSKGMKQKIGIVAALQHDPAVLILDEPTSGLDPLMQTRFVELVQEEQKRGKTILMSSHMFEEVERTCQRVGIIRAGHLVAIDTIDTLRSAQQRRYVISLASPQEAAAFAAETGGTQDNTLVTVAVKNDMASFIAAMSRHAVTNIAAPNQSLEEIFMHYYGEEPTA